MAMHPPMSPKQLYASWDSAMEMAAGPGESLESAMIDLEASAPVSANWSALACGPVLPPGSITSSDELRKQLDKRMAHVSIWMRSAPPEDAAQLERRRREQQFEVAIGKRVELVDEVMKDLDVMFRGMDVILSLYRNIEAKTTEVRDASRSLLMQKDNLLEKARMLKNVLSFFDDAREISQKINSMSALSCEDFIEVLQRIDECSTFMRKHINWLESRKYLIQFQRLKSRALSSLHKSFETDLRQTAESRARRQRDKQSVSTSSDDEIGWEMKMLLDSRALADRTRPIFGFAESKSAEDAEYGNFVAECQRAYFDISHAATYDLCQLQLTALSQNSELNDYARSASLYLVKVCSVEAKLFQQFFGETQEGIEMIEGLLRSLGSLFYSQMRPAIIHETSIDNLAEMISILRIEVIDGEVAQRGDVALPIVAAVERTIEDLQERLAYRAQTYIRDQIRMFNPTAEELNFPHRLKHNEGKPMPDDPSSVVMYPVVERTLSCLSKLYQCLSKPVFKPLAQEATLACTSSLEEASRLIARQSSTSDSLLFHIKYLLVLRKEISIFDVAFDSTEISLDFSHTRHFFREVLRGRTSLFSFVQRSAPRVIESHVDSKQRIALALKYACENFINHATTQIIGPLISFLSEATKCEDAPIPPFDDAATVPLVNALMQSIHTSFKDSYKEIAEALTLYLGNDATEKLVKQPINTNIFQAIEELRNFVIKRGMNQSDINLSPLLELEATIIHL